jgi:release factor glutamine methyltransferase
MTTLDQSLRAGIEALASAGIGSPRLTAETLLMFTLGRDRAHLLAHPERVLTEDEASRFDAALTQRVRGVPAQYITGHQEFWGMDLLVSPAVLIPRPETEHLVEAVLHLARAFRSQCSFSPGVAPPGVPSPCIVDVGTGSGCVALALAKELPHAEIHALDISPAALEIARSNAERHGLLERVRFQESDLLGAFSLDTARFDLVVSNPPYVSETDRHSLQPEVRDFEPHAALFAGPSGLDVIERLIPQAQRALKCEGWLVMEIGQGQQEPVDAVLSKWNHRAFVKDLQGIPRIVQAQRP